jgi:hypothetical protein
MIFCLISIAAATCTRHRQLCDLIFLGGLLAEHAAVYPDLHANGAIGRERDSQAVIHVGFQRRQRDAAQDLLFGTAHFRTAKPTGQHDLDAAGTGLHRRLSPLLHHAAEACATL